RIELHGPRTNGGNADFPREPDRDLDGWQSILQILAPLCRQELLTPGAQHPFEDAGLDQLEIVHGDADGQQIGLGIDLDGAEPAVDAHGDLSIRSLVAVDIALRHDLAVLVTKMNLGLLEVEGESLPDRALDGKLGAKETLRDVLVDSDEELIGRDEGPALGERDQLADPLVLPFEERLLRQISRFLLRGGAPREKEKTEGNRNRRARISADHAG